MNPVHRRLVAAGNTLVPAVLALESLGFKLMNDSHSGVDLFRAIRGDEEFLAEDPLMLLGLVKMVEIRGWNWCASDVEVESAIHRFDRDS